MEGGGKFVKVRDKERFGRVGFEAVVARTVVIASCLDNSAVCYAGGW